MGACLTGLRGRIDWTQRRSIGHQSAGIGMYSHNGTLYPMLGVGAFMSMFWVGVVVGYELGLGCAVLLIAGLLSGCIATVGVKAGTSEPAGGGARSRNHPWLARGDGHPVLSPGAGSSRCMAVLILSLVSPLVMGGGDGPVAIGAKIRIDLSILNDSGLYGPSDGLRALHYEFCIPDRPDAVSRVRRIDASVRMHRARGRIGCSASELLCTGNTHQPDYREVLEALSRLPFVARIVEAFFE
jgi:hypothetical protein